MNEELQIAFAAVTPAIALMTFIGGLVWWAYGKMQGVRKDDKKELKEFVAAQMGTLVSELKELNRNNNQTYQLAISNQTAINRIEGVLLGAGLATGNLTGELTITPHPHNPSTPHPANPT